MEVLPTIPGYKIIKRIGQGGFGEVFHASRDSDQKDFVAVKIMTKHPFVDGEPMRFSRECQSLSRLAHRAIVRLRDFEQSSGTPFIVTDFVDGKNLRDAVDTRSHEQRVNMMIEILDGLKHAHEHKIYHRDVKPSNIVVRDSDNQPVLLDFGLAYIWDGVTRETLTTQFVGTIGYIPPEVQADPKHRSPGHDIYSSAVTLYELLASKLPVSNNYVSLAAIDEGLVGLDPIIKRAMAPEEQRYASIADFLSDLRNWVSRRQIGTGVVRSELIEKFRAGMIRNKQSADDVARRSALMTGGMTTAMQEADAFVVESARSAFKSLINAMADVEGADWVLSDFSAERTAAHTNAELFRFSSKTKAYTLIFARSSDAATPLPNRSQQGLNGWPPGPKPLQQQPRIGMPVMHQKPHRFCIPCWILYDYSQAQSPNSVIRGGIAAYNRSQNDITGVPDLEYYAHGQGQTLLNDLTAFTEYWFTTAAKWFGVPIQ